MKVLTKSLSAAIILIAFTLSAHAQASETATATATIVTPINIANATDMNFDVTGQANFTYSITLPASPAEDVTITNGTDNMTVSTFTSTPSGIGTLDGTGAQTLSVGATLNVVGGESSGVYTGGPFTVTVNYN